MSDSETLLEYEKAKKENHLWWLKRFLKNKFVWAQLGIIALFLILGLVGPFFAPYSYEKIDLGAGFQEPSVQHILGTDRIGRDLFTRILFAGQTTLIIALLTLIFGGFLLALALGLISGYFGGWRDWIIMRLGEVFAMMPGFFMLIFFAATIKPRYEEFFRALGPSGNILVKTGAVDFSLIFFIFALFFWVGTARVIRSQVLVLREALFVDAAKVLGASHYRIIRKHILPNLANILVLELSAILVTAIGVEIGLSFLNLGITPPRPSFGLMFSESISPAILEKHAYILIIPGVIIVSVIFATKRLADNLIKILESRS